MSIKLPTNYQSKLDVYDTQIAIGKLKELFANNLSNELNLKRVSAPLFVTKESGLNDNLNGYERPVAFDIKNMDSTVEVVHSLAKWKRLALYNYHFNIEEGLYTDMNAIRRDEDLDNIHSVYVDQWDWEKVIDKENATLDYLKETVRKICHAIKETNIALNKEFPKLSYTFDENVVFITTRELEKMYPNNTPKERENLFVKDHPTTFLMQIGWPLANGMPHDGRAPDYDNWSLNGDLLVYNDILEQAFEISSMGVRVDSIALDKQLDAANCKERKNLVFHKMLLNNDLPQTIGGGIGQSRLSMLLLEKAHIGEVQVSVWDDDTIINSKKGNVNLL